MKNKLLSATAAAAVSIGLMMASNVAWADPGNPQSMGAEWWQWALSITTALNPQSGSDPGYSAAGKCVVGQHGSVWFLAGLFNGGTATRNCPVPEGVPLFFPVINSVQIDTPGVCGQVGHIDVKDLRTSAASFINGTTTLSAVLDGNAIHNLQRLQSPVFTVALPEDNIFDAPCAPLNVPAGIYSPAVDDGFYVQLEPLKSGQHTLRIQSANPGQGFALDVTYNLSVVPVSNR